MLAVFSLCMWNLLVRHIILNYISECYLTDAVPDFGCEICVKKQIYKMVRNGDRKFASAMIRHVSEMFRNHKKPEMEINICSCLRSIISKSLSVSDFDHWQFHIRSGHT